MSIALVGDSFIRRLDDHMTLAGIPDFKLSQECSKAVCFGRGGATTCGKKPIVEHIDAALALPDLKLKYLHV